MSRIQHANIVAVVSVLYSFPFYRDVQLFLSNSLKRIGFRQRYPDAGLAFNVRKFDSIDELELVRAFNDGWIICSATRHHESQEKYEENPKPHGQLGGHLQN